MRRAAQNEIASARRHEQVLAEQAGADRGRALEGAEAQARACRGEVRIRNRAEAFGICRGRAHRGRTSHLAGARRCAQGESGYLFIELESDRPRLLDNMVTGDPRVTTVTCDHT
jgi:hypothetical protein